MLIVFAGGLMLSVQDSATTEESEKVLQPENVMGPESASNLLSSGKFCLVASILFSAVNILRALLNCYSDTIP